MASDNKAREKVIIILAAVCIAALVGVNFVYTPLVAMWNGNTEKIAKLKTDIAKDDSLIKQKNSIISKWDSYQKKSLNINNSVAMDDVAKAVDRWTNDSGFNRISFKPAWTVDQPDHGLIEGHITGQGSMKQIAQFLFEMETDPLPIKIEESTVAAVDQEGANLALTVRFTALQLRKGKAASSRGARTPTPGGV